MQSFYDAAKERQGHFRDTSPTITAEGATPLDASGQRNGHLLANGCEEENLYPTLRGEKGATRFFIERDINGWGKTGRPPRSMVSSQVACVNFLLPLAEIEGAILAVIRAIDGDVTSVATIEHQGNLSPVEFEWIGLGGPLEKGEAPTRGKYVTNIDALIVAETHAGRRAYLLEWKYTESYGRNAYKGEGKAGETRRRRYSGLYSAESSSFNGTVPMDYFLYEPFYQLMRLRLLADLMACEEELGVTEAKVVVVVPEGNTAYRETITSPPLKEKFKNCQTVSGVFRATLKQPEKAFGIVCPSVLVEAVERDCGAAASEWVKYQRERYGLYQGDDWALSEAQVAEGMELADMGLAEDASEWPPY